MTRVWGRIIYRGKSDKHGFRTGTCAPGEAEKAWLAIFVIGDSFVEAIGSSYEQSFAGLMACDAAQQKKAVWNLGFTWDRPVGRDRARWPFDQKLLESWGRRGLEIAGSNLDKLVGLCRDWQCRVTMVVYPWSDNVVAKDRDSLRR